MSVVSKASGKGADHYSRAGGVANEVIASIRTVASLTAEKHEVERYSSHLEGAEVAGVKAGEHVHEIIGNEGMLWGWYQEGGGV